MKILSASLLILFISLCLGAAFFVGHIFWAAPKQPSRVVEIRVSQGEPLASVLRKLHEQKLISNQKAVALWARLTGVEKRIHWGVYRFETGLPPREILSRLSHGKGVLHMVTIREGLTIKEIAELLETLQIADREKFLAETRNPEVLAAFGLEGKGMEGYLFPDTYHFTPETSEREIVVAMAERFRKKSEPLMAQYDAATPLAWHEIVTLASIIEKETGIAEERPLISAVFHNRLKRGMPLQSDPTVIYGLEQFDGNLRRKDLAQRTPYNTYRIAALPPGPICNPGIASLQAALHPADVPYLFFVSRNDGTHLFSERFETHKEAVKTYQNRAAASRRSGAPAQR